MYKRTNQFYKRLTATKASLDNTLEIAADHTKVGDLLTMSEADRKSRERLQHVHTDSYGKVGTDGFRLHMTRGKAHKCQICKKNGFEYPDIESILRNFVHAKKTPMKIETEQADLRAAFVRAGLFSGLMRSMIAYDPETNHEAISVWGWSDETGTSKNRVSVIDHTGIEVQYYVNWQYMIDALDHVGPGLVTITIQSHAAPMIIHSSDPDKLAIIMPLHGETTPHMLDITPQASPVYPRYACEPTGTRILDPTQHFGKGPLGKKQYGKFDIIKAEPTKQAVEYIIPDRGINVTQEFVELNNGDKSPRGNIEMVGTVKQVGSKPKAENKPILSLMEQVVGLASGTIATLIDRTDYETINKVHAEFIEYCQSPAVDGILTWSAAWEKFSDASRFLKRFSDDPIESQSEPPAQDTDETDDFEINVKVEYDRNWTWLYFDDESGEYIRQAEDIRAAFKEYGGKFTNKRNGNTKAWYFMQHIEFDTIEDMLYGEA